MKVLVIGATGQIGSAVVAELNMTHEVILASRSSDPAIDIGNRNSIIELLESVGVVDSVVVCAGTVPFKDLTDLTSADFVRGFENKVLGQVDVVLHALPWVSDRGSITLTTGILAREPIPTGCVGSMANGALESFVRSVATEVPRGIRVNAVSPTVLENFSEARSMFPGFIPVAPEVVVSAYVKSIEGLQTGQIFEV